MVVDRVLKDRSEILEKLPIVVDSVDKPMRLTEKLDPAFVERLERATRIVDDSLAAAVDNDETAN